MSITETTWRPTIHSVEKKNRKWMLASALMKILTIAQECKDEETKKKLINVLVTIL